LPFLRRRRPQNSRAWSLKYGRASSAPPTEHHCSRRQAEFTRPAMVQFQAEGTAYYKEPTVVELDAHYGDVECDITGCCCAFQGPRAAYMGSLLFLTTLSLGQQPPSLLLPRHGSGDYAETAGPHCAAVHREPAEGVRVCNAPRLARAYSAAAAGVGHSLHTWKRVSWRVRAACCPLPRRHPCTALPGPPWCQEIKQRLRSRTAGESWKPLARLTLERVFQL
jgi:hypothetical protein